MAKERPGMCEIRLIFESRGSRFSNARTQAHIMNRISDVLGQVEDTNIAAEFVDEHGHRLRKSEFGVFSPEMRKVVNYKFETEAVGA